MGRRGFDGQCFFVLLALGLALEVFLVQLQGAAMGEVAEADAEDDCGEEDIEAAVPADVIDGDAEQARAQGGTDDVAHEAAQADGGADCKGGDYFHGLD